MVLVGSDATGHAVAEPSIDVSQLVSDANNGYQSHLLKQLHNARRSRGRTVEEVAKLLGTDAAVVEDIESGDYEPNLTELRQYAWAIEAVIEYRVHACAGVSLSQYRFALMTSALVEEVWAPGGEIPWSDESSATSLTAVVKIVEGDHD